MLLKRTLAALVIAAIGFPAILLGGIWFFLLIAIFVGMAAWEYVNIFRVANFTASMGSTVGGTLAILFVRAYFPEYASALLAFLVLLAMTIHLFAYEKGNDHAATDFAITLGGLLVLGWLGAYLVDLRNMEDGLWYLFLSLGTIWCADTAAYFIGGRFGKHKMAPRLSPKKSWEGYWAGVFFGTLGGAGLAVLFQALGGPDVTWWQGGGLGLVMSLVTTLGDIGESMIKRQAGVKDSSNIIPGHGGFFDRIDAWLWGGVIGYYLITWFIK